MAQTRTRAKQERRATTRRSGRPAAPKTKSPASGAASGRRKTTRSAAAPRSRKARGATRGHRLAADVRPLEVAVHVEVDPARSSRFRGQVSHRLEVGSRRRSIELHAADLALSRAHLEVGGRRLRGRITLHPERQTAVVRFDEMVPAGEARLHLAFSGRLRSDLRGLYAARSGERRYAFTQLEAADARRFFPCFDEPAMKARFALSVTTGNRNTVLSNTPVAKVEPLGDGLKTVHFRPTPPLSTYLLALAVGELEASSAVHCGPTEIRVWHVPGKAQLTAFALECARETLSRLEGYFDLPYPYEKLDLVAVPDFEAGAMENAGAVFFRETALLVDEATGTLQERKRVAEVICHELAHMWYGDLVTMAWWNDLWLNEAFATWMAFQIVDSWKPEWRMWHDFQHHRASALSTDALEHTHSIYTEVRSPEEATQNFDVITYEKGASVVRMVERFLGPKAFRAGVRTYIRRHREGNTEAADLWRALEEASGQKVEPVVRAWIEQPGFPLLRVQRYEEEGRAGLLFRQERFHARPGVAGQKTTARWPIPWVGRLGSATGRGSSLARHLVTRARERVELDGAPPRFVYGNADEGGFFRPLHDEGELIRIASDLGALTGVERMGLVNHQWAAVRAAHARLDGFLQLATAFGREADPDVLLTLRGPLGWVEDRLAPELGEDAAARLRARVEGIFGPAFAEAGWDPAAGERDEAKLRRAALLSLVGDIARSAAVLSEAASRCRRYLDDRGSLDPNLADAVVNLAARGGDSALYERLLAAAGEARTPQERRRMLMALAEFRAPALIERTLELTLGDAVGTQDVAIVLTRLLGNPAARARTWAFMKRRWSALLRRMPPMLVTRPVEALPALGSRVARNDVAAFFKAHPVPTAARALRQALERFDLDLELSRRAAPDLARWLGAGR